MYNPVTLRYLDWMAMTLEDAEEWVAGQSVIRFPHTSKCCHLAVEEVQVAKVIGLVTFWFLNDEFDLAQFEVIVHSNFQREEYATEAIRGLLKYAFKGLRVRRIVAECDGRNLPARSLLLKTGLRKESECIQNRLQKSQWINTA